MGYPWCLTLKNGWVRVGKEASQFPGSGVERGLENFEDFSKVKIGRLPCQGREVLKNRGLSGKTQGEKVTDREGTGTVIVPVLSPRLERRKNPPSRMELATEAQKGAPMFRMMSTLLSLA